MHGELEERLHILQAKRVKQDNRCEHYEMACHFAVTATNNEASLVESGQIEVIMIHVVNQRMGRGVVRTL